MPGSVLEFFFFLVFLFFFFFNILVVYKFNEILSIAVSKLLILIRDYLNIFDCCKNYIILSEKNYELVHLL